MDLKPTMSPASSILNRGEWFGAAFSGSVPGTVTPTKKNRPGTCRAKTEESPGRSQIVRVPRPWSPVTWRTIACAPRRGQRSDHRCRHQEKPRNMNGGLRNDAARVGRAQFARDGAATAIVPIFAVGPRAH